MAADMARRALGEGRTLPTAAVAKARAGEAAGVGASIAHQVHGAIGFTLEACTAILHEKTLVMARRVRQRTRMERGLRPTPFSTLALISFGPKSRQSKIRDVDSLFFTLAEDR
jgi:alkylation response protein AidB-like acyl-CoA dehydrogenase